jgi:(1->4)-alpha-D-glucan 1-alpha-D-glucosylmutase
MMHIPIATYRIQFNLSFGFRDAQGIIPYLAALGISDIYASPIFKARKGSMHGYDIVDPNQLNPELGEYDDFEELRETGKVHGLYWLQDIVPNHMAYDSENSMLMDVLENGEFSPYLHFFDIDWNHPYESMKGKVLAPFLGKFYAESLEEGEIQLHYDEAGLYIKYYNLRLPLKIESYTQIIEHNINELEQRLAGTYSDLIKFLGVFNLFKAISSHKEKDTRKEQIRHAKRMLWNLYNENETIRNFINENIAFFNGTRGDPESFNALDKLISEQLFRLSFWKVATEEVNYRRFFNVNDLICLKVEDETVFNYTHDLIFRFSDQGKFDGLRIDHIDGLHDPVTYLKRLRQKSKDVYIIVEKILDHKEQLPSSWPVQGTTGYDLMNYTNGLFCKKENEVAFSKLFYKFTDLHIPYEELLGEKKRMIIGKHMAGNIDNLAHFLKTISSKDRYGSDITLYGLKRALVEVMAFFPIYRTYVNYDSFSESDQISIKEAIQKARESLPGFLYELNFIEKFLLLKYDTSIPEDDKRQWIHFVMNFQQHTGPLMAKGFEDTMLYIYNKLISLNEVGSNPNKFGFSIKEFHNFNKRRATASPHTLNATSTHDTKRGEDVRARINILSEIPKEWEYNLKTWRKINRSKKKKVNNRYIPDENDEYLIYQTLIGTFPFDDEESTFTERIKNYIVKAVREAKVHTAWLKPDTEYEQGCISFIEKILQPSKENEFLKTFSPFQKKIAYYGIFNSLSQTLVKITSPGVPDFYQGTELWDLNLVDPDNRRPVDFKKRELFLQNIKEREKHDIIGFMSELFSKKEDGKIKLFLIYKALQARKERSELFQEGSYIPIEVNGKFKNNIVAYARTHQNAWTLTIVPRFFTALINEGELPFGEHIWGDTYISLPEGAPSSWKDTITEQVITAKEKMSVCDVLKYFSVSLLLS